MKGTGKKLILLSFIIALVATIMLFMYLQGLKSPKPLVKKTTVLMAAETIPPRTLIEKKMIKEVEVSDNSIFGECIKDYSQIVGKYSKETILKDEGFRKDKLMGENSDELSLKLEKDYRAISINVSQDAGISGLLKPNDFVDIIAYLAEKKDGSVVVRPDLAKIVLQDIEVIAVDKQMNRDDKTKEDAKAVNNFLVTLSVRSSDLEKLVLSESIGNIKLALRPLNTDSTITTNGEKAEDLLVDDSSNNSSVTNNSDNGAGSNNAASYKTYTVKRGDTLKKISTNFYGSPDKYSIIKDANNIGDENIIITGEVIKIPVLN